MNRSESSREIGLKGVGIWEVRLVCVTFFWVLLFFAAGGQVAWAAVNCADTVTTGVPQAECEALVALYNSTDGANWTVNTNWNTNTSIDNWYGVVASGGVVKLYLDTNNLSGTIPPELSNLNNLVELRLNSNVLTGSIPSELGSLDSLTELRLFGNELSGSIPSELGSLGNLQELGLHYNQLTGPIPPELGNLSNLQDLRLFNNLLTGPIPPELGNLSNLKSLILDNNPLGGEIPPEIGSLGNLEQLHLQSNQLTGAIPSELGDLGNLQRLNLGGNQFSSAIPIQLGNLGKLRSLYIPASQLIGAIPPELGNLSNLETLGLFGNQLSGEIPSSLSNLTALLGVFIDYNMLTASGSVATFLEDKNANWANTQTVPPTGLGTGIITSSNAEITWTPIPYTDDGGFYRVKYATNSGGLYVEAGTTANKQSTSYTVTGLNPNTSYYFVVETFTPAHGGNLNDLTSPLSTEISVTTEAAPEIALSGKDNPIADGDTAIATNNGTDFGSVYIGSGTAVQTFTISNTGGGTLNLEGAPPVEIIGLNFDEFSVTSAPATTVAGGGGTTTFEITFDPTGPGTRTATVTIPNDDPDESSFDFAISGVGLSPVPPSVSTDSMANITGNSATANATVSANGGASVTERGVCYGLNPNPTTADNQVQAGSGTGAFSASLAGLQPGNTYFVRAYAINAAGTAYGNEITFSTNAELPQVSTGAISNVLSDSAQANGTVTSDGGAAVTERGFCWSTSTNPTISDFSQLAGSGTGAFSASLDGLSAETLYYVRAYAKNSAGISYGNQLTFTTSEEPIQPGDADGNGEVELTDAILILQILTGDTDAAAGSTLEADVNNDGRLGLEDAVYILRVVSQTP